MTREQIKSLILKDSTEHKFVCAELATSVGKNLVGIEFVNIHLNSGKFLWVVPEIDLIDNAKKEFEKWSFSHLIDQGIFVCYNSLHKYKGQTFDCIVWDEVHHLISDLRFDATKEIKSYKHMGLSATIDAATWELLNRIGNWKTTKVSLEEAIEYGILSEPSVKVKYIDLDDKIKKHPFKYKDKTVLKTEQEFYDAISQSITYWLQRYETEGEPFAANKFKGLGSERIRFLAQVKTPYVQSLLEELHDKRTVVFCGSVEQAKGFSVEQHMSSEKTQKQNKLTLEGFNNKQFNHLFLKQKLQEGANFVDVPCGIIIQLGNKELPTQQRLGRIMRHHSPELYLFICKDTVDERYLKSSFQSVKSLIK